MRSLVTSIFLRACESWTLTAELQRRIQAMEMRCCRKILHISYKDHVINEEVRAKKNAYKQTPIPSEESTFSSKTAVGIFAGRLPRLANTIALGNVFYSVSRMEETVGN